jgi:hypothetical protein
MSLSQTIFKSIQMRGLRPVIAGPAPVIAGPAPSAQSLLAQHLLAQHLLAHGWASKKRKGKIGSQLSDKTDRGLSSKKGTSNKQVNRKVWDGDFEKGFWQNKIGFMKLNAGLALQSLLAQHAGPAPSTQSLLAQPTDRVTVAIGPTRLQVIVGLAQLLSSHGHVSGLPRAQGRKQTPDSDSPHDFAYGASWHVFWAVGAVSTTVSSHEIAVKTQGVP